MTPAPGAESCASEWESTGIDYAQESARTGVPSIRPLEWAYPNAGYTTVKNQFMPGNRVLAAPVVTKDACSYLSGWPLSNRPTGNVDSKLKYKIRKIRSLHRRSNRSGRVPAGPAIRGNLSNPMSMLRTSALLLVVWLAECALAALILPERSSTALCQAASICKAISARSAMEKWMTRPPGKLPTFWTNRIFVSLFVTGIKGLSPNDRSRQQAKDHLA
jgi:hypothetical protein